MPHNSPLSMPQLWHALHELERSWASPHWAGLPTILTNSLATMGYTPAWRARQSGAIHRWLRALDALAHDVEQLGLSMAKRGLEPQYHNRKHTAQVLVSMVALLMVTRDSDRDHNNNNNNNNNNNSNGNSNNNNNNSNGNSNSNSNSSSNSNSNVNSQGLANTPYRLSTANICQELAQLGAALGHDALHDGRRNHSPSETEERSASWVVGLLQARGLRAAWCQRVATIIERTAPQHVTRNHEQLRAQRSASLRNAEARARRNALNGQGSQSNRHSPNSLGNLNLCCVLANEADILASALPDIGMALTECLAQEWDKRYPTDAQGLRTDSGRRFFLQHLALFSSAAADVLGLPAIRQAQLDARPTA
jgi:hypothetical protein